MMRCEVRGVRGQRGDDNLPREIYRTKEGVNGSGIIGVVLVVCCEFCLLRVRAGVG